MVTLLSGVRVRPRTALPIMALGDWNPLDHHGPIRSASCHETGGACGGSAR